MTSSQGKAIQNTPLRPGVGNWGRNGKGGRRGSRLWPPGTASSSTCAAPAWGPRQAAYRDISKDYKLRGLRKWGKLERTDQKLSEGKPRRSHGLCSSRFPRAQVTVPVLAVDNFLHSQPPSRHLAAPSSPSDAFSSAAPHHQALQPRSPP